MSSDPRTNLTPDEPNRAKMLRVMIPAGGIIVGLIVVAVVVSMSTAGGHPMSDGSDGTTHDPDLKEITKGVQYRDLKEGSGEACPQGAEVKVNYTGWLTDGTVFDSNKGKDVFVKSLKDVVAGWQIGIPGMKPGGIRKLVIAPEQGYGNQGMGKIPPGATLIFEVELIGVVPPGSEYLAPLFQIADGPGRPMSDGSDGSTRDPDLKDIGGMKIRDLKEGSGDPVQPGSTVTVNYSGWLADGTPFDSNKGKEPITFPLTGVVKGWTKGIPGMKPGGIRKLVIPPALGYEDIPKGKIPASSTLIFEVELVK